MADPVLTEVMERAASWPLRDRAKLVAAAKLIEAQQEVASDLTADDWQVIDRRIEAAARGDVASDREAAAFFGKYLGK